MYTINIHIHISSVFYSCQTWSIISYQIGSYHIIPCYMISVHIHTYMHNHYQVKVFFWFKSYIVGLSSDKPAIWWHSACRAAELPRLSPWVHRKPVLQPWLDAFHLGSKLSIITSSYLHLVGVMHCCIWKWTASGKHCCSLPMVQLCRKLFIRLVKAQNRDSLQDNMTLRWWVYSLLSGYPFSAAIKTHLEIRVLLLLPPEQLDRKLSTHGTRESHKVVMCEDKDIFFYISAFQPNPSASQHPIDGAVPTPYIGICDSQIGQNLPYFASEVSISVIEYQGAHAPL